MLLTVKMFNIKYLFKISKRIFSLIWKVLSDLWRFKASVVIILSPLLLLPLITVVNSKESRCLYVVLIMAFYWVTEAVPLAVTSMIPLFLFPILGVLPAKKVASEYVQDPTFLFIGGYLIAMAIENAQIHRRLAMKAILIVGSNPKCILIGVMIITGFLSMWMSNTATTAMMLPIVEAILTELIKDKRSLSEKTSTVIGNVDLERGPGGVPAEPFKLEKESMSSEELNLCKMMFLSVCYSSNIGGIGTLTGSPTNVIAVGILERIYGANTGVTFASWMAYALPLTVLNLIFSWFLLLLMFYGFRNTFYCGKEKKSNVLDSIRANYKLLGPLNFHEIIVAILFAFIVLLWAFRAPKVIPGWSDFFQPGYVSDATSAMFIAFLLFVLPTSPPDFLCYKARNIEEPPQLRKTLLDWKVVQTKFPWGLVFLIGGGFTMASAIEESGLSKEIGNAMSSLSYLSAVGICAIAAIFATFATEVTTNMGVVSILAPILSAVAEKLSINPLYFVLTVTVCVSYAFMLPIATPPNAIVFGCGYIRVIDMIKIGFFLNWFAIGLTLLAINTWAWKLFDLGTFPAWACHGNCTHSDTVNVFFNVTDTTLF